MATDLTELWGNEITVSCGAYQVDRQYSGFAGCDGLTGMNLGGRGNPVIVRSRYRASGADYSTARGLASAVLQLLKDNLYLPADDYEFNGETFEQVVWERIEPIANQSGKSYHLTSASEVIIDFIALGRTLI
ncbi:MAG TPA: hypothetical protein DDW84_02300 [Phycisphaerales bacterium]|nr:hypothetical protein [Phycisphaerales bacterium]HBR20144.1 hypothetical protein [Phycisphaerales bacterium]